MEKICPRCSASFVCRVDDIELCNCSKIQLSVGVRGYIKDRFGKCLCFDCLQYINQNIKSIIQNETNNNLQIS